MLFATPVAEPPPIGWFQRVFFGRVNPAGALAALHNLFAATGRASEEQMSAVLKRYGVVQGDAKRSVLLQLCSDSLARILTGEPDRIADGRRQVHALATAVGLSARDTAEAESRASSAHVRGVIHEALEDRKFTEEERTRVRSVGTALGMKDTEIDALVHGAVEPLLKSAVEAALDDRRYSPSEESALRQFAADLGVSLELGPNADEAAKRYRLLWEIENGHLPEVFAPITLQRKEVCHFSCSCSWRELRTRTVRVNYSGPTARIRIMKGVYWRVGSIAPQRVTETDLVEVASGTLYVTSKRVLLDGSAGNKSVTWRSVFGQELYSDAIKLEKSSGKDPYLFLPASEIELASSIIANAMAAAG